MPAVIPGRSDPAASLAREARACPRLDPSGRAREDAAKPKPEESPMIARLLGLACALALAVPAAAQTVTMRVSHQVPTAHHLHGMLESFAADVKQRTGGQVDVQLFPAEQLHKAAENYPAVARGAVEAALSVSQQWGNTIPEMNGPVIPFLFNDLEKIKRFPGSDAAKLLDKKLEEKGVHNLVWFYITR